MNPNYKYQDKIVREAWKNLGLDKEFLIACSPGAGKTRMSFRIIEKQMRKKKVSKILVLSHGTNVLRSQWCDVARELGVEYSEVKSHTKIDHSNLYISLPHSLGRVGKMQFDLVIVDEAHHYLKGKMVQRFLSKQKNTKLLLLTGSPGDLIAEGVRYTGVTLSEMLKFNVASDPEIELWSSAYKIELSDYNHGEVAEKAKKKITKKGTILSLETLREKADLKKVSEKCLFVAHNRIQAAWISEWLDENGVENSLSISDSESDEYYFDDGSIDDDLDRFKSGEVTCAVVVNRGILGFDFPEMRRIVDMSCSMNHNRMFQLLCRLTRRYKGKKTYIKLSSDSLLPLNYHLMSYVTALCLPDYYYSPLKFDKKREIPVSREFMACLKERSKEGAINLQVPRVNSFQKTLDEIEKGLCAYTSFSHVVRSLGREQSLDEILEYAARYKSAREFSREDHGTYLKMRNRLGAAKMHEFFGDSYDPKVLKIDLDYARKEVGKYKNRYDVKKHNVPLYKWMLKNDREYFDSVIPSTHRHTWTWEKGLKALETSESRLDFTRGLNGAYRYMLRADREKTKKLLDEKFGCPVENNSKWTLETAIEAAKKCKSKSFFKRSQSGAYNFLLTRYREEFMELDFFYRKRRNV